MHSVHKLLVSCPVWQLTSLALLYMRPSRQRTIYADWRRRLWTTGRHSCHPTNSIIALTRVSRPYSWSTLATCVHNCPSMMFWTCCCLCPKCKRSYLLIYIPSGSYVNKLNVRYLIEILALQIVAKQLQLATWELTNTLSNGTIADPLRRTV